MEKEIGALLSLCLSVRMIDGPNWIVGPTCRVKGGREWVPNRVHLAKLVRVVLILILNFHFMLIFENPYLMLGNSKNSTCGLFGNLEK
jgi:hypothetical protein